MEGQGSTKEATGNESRAGKLELHSGPHSHIQITIRSQREEQDEFLSQNIASLKNFGIRNKSLARDF